MTRGQKLQVHPGSWEVDPVLFNLSHINSLEALALVWLREKGKMSSPWAWGNLHGKISSFYWPFGSSPKLCKESDWASAVAHWLLSELLGRVSHICVTPEQKPMSLLTHFNHQFLCLQGSFVVICGERIQGNLPGWQEEGSLGWRPQKDNVVLLRTGSH